MTPKPLIRPGGAIATFFVAIVGCVRALTRGLRRALAHFAAAPPAHHSRQGDVSLAARRLRGSFGRW